MPMKRLKPTRGVVRSVVTRTLNLVNDLLRGPELDSTDMEVYVDFLVQRDSQLTNLDTQVNVGG